MPSDVCGLRSGRRGVQGAQEALHIATRAYKRDSGNCRKARPPAWAAAFFNRCRAESVQGSNTDFLICAAAARRKLGILTTDGDFVHFAKLLPIQLHSPRSSVSG